MKAHVAEKPAVQLVAEKPAVQLVAEKPAVQLAKAIDSKIEKPIVSSNDGWRDFFEELNSQESLIITESVQDEYIAQDTLPTTLIQAGISVDDISMRKYITNGNMIDMSLDEDIKFDINDRDSFCTSCGEKLFVSRNILICKSCGVELQNSSNMTEEEYSTSAITDCNVNSNGFIAMKMIGKGSYGYQRSLLKTCANYSKYRRINTLKDMKNWNIHSKKHHIPKNVIKEANEMFAQIKERGYVFRKDGKKGVLSACLYYACYNNNISKTPSE